MKEFFVDIFKYHHHYNQELADLLIENKDKISERTVPLFSHCMNAHQIWNSRITGADPYTVHQLHTLTKCKEIDSDNYMRMIDFNEYLTEMYFEQYSGKPSVPKYLSKCY